MKLSKKVLAAFSVAAALAMAGTFVACSEEEDEYDMLNVSGDNASISFTNDKDVGYARAFKTTNTAHLSADMTIVIDYGNSSDSGYTCGYIFDLDGKGTESNPYSFALIGIRYTTKPQYFISYYTNVLSSDCSSDTNDFDTDSNTAYEYAVTGTSSAPWTDIPSGSYTNDSTAKTLTVYVDVDAYYGTTEITNDNYNTKVTEQDNKTYEDLADSYKVTLKASADATSGTEKTVSLTTVNAGKSNGGKNAPELTEFPVAQNKLGYYAMVSKDKTLNAKWTRGEFVLSDEVVEE